jgi:hypothetical protein
VTDTQAFFLFLAIAVIVWEVPAIIAAARGEEHDE